MSQRPNPPSAPKGTYYVSEEFAATKVERVLPPPGVLGTRIVLPDEARPPEAYALVLRDEHGKDVQIFWEID